MKPTIEATSFGSITIAGERHEHDIVIGLDGRVRRRRKQLSKAVTGTSHRVARAEAEDIFVSGAERLIVGSGQGGGLALSDEANDFIRERGCTVQVLPTPEAVKAWNAAGGAVIALFHVTC